MTTERAPVAGQQGGRGGAGGGRSHGGRSILEGLVDPERAGALNNPVVDQLLRGGGPGGRPSPFGSLLDMPSTPGGDGSGAAAAAGVLTAVDEDNEGDEEAKVPDEFEYFSELSDTEEED